MQVLVRGDGVGHQRVVSAERPARATFEPCFQMNVVARQERLRVDAEGYVRLASPSTCVISREIDVTDATPGTVGDLTGDRAVDHRRRSAVGATT